MTAHIVQFSTGIGSAEVLRRVALEQGVKNTVALTADTLVEDEDNWRFAREVVRMVGCRWITLADGRTPMQAGLDARVVPNNRMAVCSRVLKRDLLRMFIETYYGTDAVIYLGFDWTEPNRHAAAAPLWLPYEVRSPLLDPPYREKAALLEEWQAYGIRPPRLYAEGFSHANCGGCCVRGGQAQWELALRKRPETYAEWELAEEVSRNVLGKDVSILRNRRGGNLTPLTLRDFRLQLESQPSLFETDDWGACNCMDGAE